LGIKPLAFLFRLKRPFSRRFPGKVFPFYCTANRFILQEKIREFPFFPPGSPRFPKTQHLVPHPETAFHISPPFYVENVFRKNPILRDFFKIPLFWWKSKGYPTLSCE